MNHGNIIQVQGTQHYGCTIGQAIHECQPHGRADAVCSLILLVFHKGLFSIAGKSRVHLRDQVKRLPCGTCDGLGFQVLFRGNHGIVDSFGKFHAGFRTAIVVLASAYVACGAREVNVRATRFILLALLTGEPRIITAYMSLTIMAHRMAGIVMAGKNFLGTIVKRHRLQHRVYQTFWKRDQLRVLARATPHLGDLAIGTNGNPAIASHLFHFALALGDMG